MVKEALINTDFKSLNQMIKKNYPFLLSELPCIAKTSEANMPTKAAK